MARIYVRGQLLDVDILRELERTGYQWRGLRITRNKLIACSPFRPERRPSFFVNLDGQFAGYWKDSGASGEYEKGDFITLLSYLREETREETEEYLIAKYAKGHTDFQLNIRLPKPETSPRYLPFDIMKQYAFRHPYLGARGISEQVQRGLKIGYDRERKAVAIPWFDPMGRLVNIKFRSVRDKRFWYYRGGLPIKNYIYGIHVIYKRRVEEAVLVEAEIDCMTLWTRGIPAIAAGTNNLTEAQINLMKRCPLKRLVICPDNDEAGLKLLEAAQKHLRGFLDLYKWELPKKYKDVNEAHTAGAPLIYQPSPLSSLSVKFSF